MDLSRDRLILELELDTCAANGLQKLPTLKSPLLMLLQTVGFETFMVAVCNDVFLGGQSLKNRVTAQSSEDCLCPHYKALYGGRLWHSSHQPLIMEILLADWQPL
jgi:hypothetical protein